VGTLTVNGPVTADVVVVGATLLTRAGMTTVSRPDGSLKLFALSTAWIINPAVEPYSPLYVAPAVRFSIVKFVSEPLTIASCCLLPISPFPPKI
jgi:hypothetical protein